MASCFPVRIFIYFVKRRRIPLFNLNELGEKFVNLAILGKFVNKPSNSHWLISFQKMFFIGRNLKKVHRRTYSFLKLLIFF